MKAETFPTGRRQAPAAILINQKLIYNLKGGRGKAYAAVCLQRQIKIGAIAPKLRKGEEYVCHY